MMIKIALVKFKLQNHFHIQNQQNINCESETILHLGLTNEYLITLNQFSPGKV